MANQKYFDVLLDYLGLGKLALEGGVTQSNFDALVERVFGSKNPSILDIAKKSYTADVARPLSGMGQYDGRTAFVDAVCRLIKEQIEILFREPASSQATFDLWHKETCDGILALTADLPLKRAFCFGVAQKWLNMTLKNMLITEQWSAEFQSIVDVLHCPVDSYIISAAKALGGKTVRIPKKENKVSKPWSQWDSDDYYGFQNALRIVVGEQSLIEWEMRIWPEFKNK